MTSSTSRRRSTSPPPHAKGLLDQLEKSFLHALRSGEGEAAPAALLWADADKQWAALVARLQTALPHLFVLGTYDAAKRTGPAIWLRCVVDRVLEDVALEPGVVPILYLPGVARQSLRAGDECPRELQPVVELQYRGRVWHQKNGRDWTVEAFLVSEDGLQLDVAQDAKTREAAQRSLPLLAEMPLDGLRGHRLEADDFDRLAVSDPTRDLLRWMGIGDGLRKTEGEARWKAFCGVCNSDFKFDPDKKSPADAANALVEGSGKWANVWQRFKEAPKLYPDVAKLLRDTATPLLYRGSERDAGGNSKSEQALRAGLEALANKPHATALAEVAALEAAHGKRREWVWAELGESPLACALAPLAKLAAAAANTLGGATIDAAVTAYVNDGWRCDRAALEALASVKQPADMALIQNVVRALYLPWLDASARHFQGLIDGAENAVRAKVTGSQHEKDACLMFADGLRYDVAGMLAERLEAKGYRVRLNHRLAPLPTVTSTAKPFATLSHDKLEGGEDIVDFNPRFKNSPQAATAQRLRDDMAGRGIDLLGEDIRPPKQGTTGGWLETGKLDELGHKLGARLAGQIDNELEMLLDQVTGLIDAGWTRLRIVTDHGWLLMPGGLPHVAVPSHLTTTKWSRAATVKGDAKPSVPVHAWHWNTHVRIASPPGVGSFAPNTEYSHGGISPQECIVPELIVERGGGGTSALITAITWRGMRCRVSVTTNDPTVRVDLRTNWKQANTSIAASSKEVGPAGEASLAVADDAHEGHAATIVVVDGAGNVLDRKTTTVGEAS
ncbi:BREX-1 system phosphatase PglZ type B [Corallococcus sp. EGB]|uniref:BREX-1 system phosphatase PglZ type B n=1 Tax=Corallococcus sp. EGB TaxID=1521117 RepID=UPI001CBF292F|nr:BREX-1 system phosphatase PglZ type B [Corallococcus sp. EGB]